MIRRKNILILSSWYPTQEQPFLGNFVEQQVRLIATKHLVTVIALEPLDSFDGIEVEDREVKDYREIRVRFTKGNNVVNRYFNQRKAFKRALNLIDQVDLIHAHVLLPKGYLFLLAKKKFNCPLIVTEHASYFREEQFKRLSQKHQLLLKKIIPSVDQLIAVSEVLRRDMMKALNTAAIQVIANPINSELFARINKEPDGKFKFLHISTLADIKNVVGIIEAFNIAYSTNQSLYLTIVSDEDFTALKEFSLELPCVKNIDFVGPITNNETVAYYQQADCFVLNSYYETFSIVVAEAWSCGKPVIATNVGIAYRMKSELGIQVSNNQPDLVEAMLEMPTKKYNPENIRQHAMQFDQVNVLNQINAVYDKV